MPITFCRYCGRYIPFGQSTEWGQFCNELCFERYENKRIDLYDLKLEYWIETHPQLLNYYYDRRKVGGWHPGIGEE
jgi:hypothetical protein